MRTLFPAVGGVMRWRRAALGPGPFRSYSSSASDSFFVPARNRCRRPVAAERKLSRSIPPELRKRLALSLRLWQRSQELTEAFIRRRRLVAGMDMPMTLNFAMALGNYSRYFLFSGPALPPAAAAAVHSAFVREMTLMPSAMALPRAAAFTPSASAARLAEAFNSAPGVGT